MKANLNEVRAGDLLTADNGFTCLKPGTHTVRENANGERYLDCSDGKHFLDGQASPDGTLIGLSKHSHSI